MTSYIVLFSEELLDLVRADPSNLPAGFRVGEVVDSAGARLEAPPYRSVYVNVEDDAAPGEFEGRHVELTLRRQLDSEGFWHTVITSRRVENERKAN